MELQPKTTHDAPAQAFKTMLALLIPIFAMDNPAATSGAVILVVLSVAALVRSKMP